MSLPAIILAGGLGTRLQSVVKDAPKPMADVNGKPFLHYLLKYLTTQEVYEVILSVGHKHEAIQNYFGKKYLGLHLTYSVETEPLGTGGAIKKAMSLLDDEAFVLNGDTFFPIDLMTLFQAFNHHPQAQLTVALKQMRNFDRYGTVEMNEDHCITAFREKKAVEQGLINGGVYVLSPELFYQHPFPEKFSFEKEVLEAQVTEQRFYGTVFTDFFIDIGIPEDYHKAQSDARHFPGE